MLNVE